MDRLRLRLRCGLLVIFLASGIDTSQAAPYYSALDLGSQRDVSYNQNSIRNASTATEYAFVSTTGQPLTTDQQKGLPESTVSQGYGHYNPWTVGMRVFGANDLGTVVGQLATGNGYSDVWQTSVAGYTIREADGTYSSFVPFAYTDGTASLQLSQTNQILYNDNNSVSQIFDVSSGALTSIRDLVPADLLAQYPIVHAAAIDDRGDILVDATRYGDGGTMNEEFLLTPAGSGSPVPEPAVWMLFELVAAVQGVKATVRLRRIQGD